MPELGNGLILSPETPQLMDKPSDTIPPVDRGDITNLDEDHLRGYILELFKNDIADKRQMGWTEKRAYDIKAYYGLKNDALKHIPWEGASAFPVPLTPTLTDTAHANIQASIWNNPRGPTKVNAVSVEDIRTSRYLEEFMNWQVMNEMDMETEQDKDVFRTFLHGTGFQKIFFDIKSNKVKVYSVDIENIFLPIDAHGVQPDDSDHIIHVIPLQYNDIQLRKAMGIYRYPDEIMPGIGITTDIDAEQKKQLMDQVSGTSLITKSRRDNFYVAECYLTYIPKNAYRPLELIVWISPNGGRIQRIRKNDRGLRPLADTHAYPFPDRFFSMSLPEKIRNIQEKIDYADKQNTDALDRAISPAAFFDETEQFNPQVHQRVPGGIYPKGKGNTVEWEPTPQIERGFEREGVRLWEMAERLTGVIDITQGRATTGEKTLGETKIRVTRADVRFSTVFKRFERGWAKKMNLVYEYDNTYIDRKKKLRVLGYKDFKSVDELFPNDGNSGIGLGINGTFDFNFSGALISEVEEQNQKIVAFCQSQRETNPLVLNDRASLWRITQREAEAMGIRDIETIIAKPPEADILGVEEFIERIMSGQKDIQIRPGIDTLRYVFELQLFMETETFQSLDPQRQQTLMVALRRAYVMSVAERRAQMDLELAKEGARFNAIQEQPQPEQEEKEPASV